MTGAGDTTAVPATIHVRARDGGDADAKSWSRDAAMRALQSGSLDADVDVFFLGLRDWTNARAIAALWVPIAGAPIDATGPQSGPDSRPSSSRRSLAPPSSGRSNAPSIASNRGPSFLPVLGVVAGAVALLGLGAATIWSTYFRSIPTAVRHLPRRCLAAGYADTKALASFAPFAKTIVPALLVPGASGGPDLRERLRAHAGLNLDRDLREVAVCLYDEPSIGATGATGASRAADPWNGLRFVIAFGGKLKLGSVPAIYEALRGEPWAVGVRLEGVGEASVIRFPSSKGLGGVLGQAHDGTLLFAPNDTTLAAVREARADDDAAAKTGLTQVGAVELVSQHGLLSLAVSRVPEKSVDPTIIAPIGAAAESRLVLTLGDRPGIDLSIESQHEADAKQLEGSTRALLELATKAMSKSSDDWFGEHAAIAGAKISRDEKRTTLHFPLRNDDLDRGASAFARAFADPASTFHASVVPSARVMLRLDPAPVPSASSSDSPTKAPSPHLDDDDDTIE